MHRSRRRLLQRAIAGAALVALSPRGLLRAQTVSDADATTRRARQLTMAEFRALDWQEPAGGLPLIMPPPPSPILADPTFVTPADSPDGQWHLFAHSAWGIQHFTATEPLSWRHQGIAVWHGMRGFLLRDAGAWWLYYESYPPFALLGTALPVWLRRTWRSGIARRRSTDLYAWGDEQPVLQPALDWHASELGRAVGNPCVLRVAEGGEQAWALYYSGGLRWVPDCGFTEPYAIGRALAPSPAGPWFGEADPLLAPRADDAACNLSAGSLKLLRVADGFVGLQNAIAWDGQRSTSAIFLLCSQDGRAWQRASTPLLVPGKPAWRRSHVYACDLRFDPAEGKWWLFYNARDDWPMDKGREAIGALWARA